MQSIHLAHGHDAESRPSGLDAEESEERMHVDNEEEVTSAVTAPNVLAPTQEQPDVVIVSEVPAVQLVAPQVPSSPATHVAHVANAPHAQLTPELDDQLTPKPVLDNRSLNNLPLFLPTGGKLPSPNEVEAFW